MKYTKEPVRLRKRKLKSGRTSLYLDIYLDGERQYEYLKLYLIPENNKEDNAKNRETLQLAEAVKSKRIVELRNGEFGFKQDYPLDTSFFAYYDKLTDSKETEGNRGNWWGAGRHLRKYAKEDTTFRDIDEEWVRGFRDYLDNTARIRQRSKTITNDNDRRKISNKTKISYFNKLKACLRQAFKDKIIPNNPAELVEGFKDKEVERVYLTLDEV